MNNKKNKRKNKNFFMNISTYFILLLFIPLIGVLYQSWDLAMIPLKFYVPVIIILIIFAAFLIWLQYNRKISKLNKALGGILLIILSVLLIFGNVLLYQARSALGDISVDAGDTQYEIVSVIVMKENKAADLNDVKDETFAINKIDSKNTNKSVKGINRELGTTIKTKDYANNIMQADALFANEVSVIIMSESYRSLLSDKYPDFSETTKVIYEFKIPKKVKNLGSNVDVNNDSYNVYISGLDTYGAVTTSSRSDVNMIATVNPNTRQIVLTSVPRDFYVKQTCQVNQEDKLTHSGIFGIDCTVNSMENFTNLTFNYYVKVNFSSLEEIVNALGGVDIYNDVDFYSGVDGSYIPAGDIHMDGSTALKFSRERHAYADGDRQRGRNQMIVLNAIINKATSPAILTGYSSIMSTVAESFETNMKSSDMKKIVKAQLDDVTPWKILQQSVTGEGGTDWTPANGFDAYVMYPDMDSVNTALININKVLDGEILDAI